MRYTKLYIQNYRAIKDELCIDLSSRIIPLVGVNECGKTTILQALFCFDYINDESGGHHLLNVKNLYSTVSDGDCIISAEITCKREELIQCVQKVIREKDKSSSTEGSGADGDVEKMDESIAWMEQFVESKEKISSITMKRNISKNKLYSCSLFGDLPEADQHLICMKIIQMMPYILYNDDFNDRPASSISLNAEKRGSWYDIFERVFQSTNSAYTLATIMNEDERRRKSIVADVENFLSNTLTEAWAKFSPEKRKISISLDLQTEQDTLKIEIKEQPNGQSPKYFSITDRSKGFIWYYNFIMKIYFNPKQTADPKGTIFLLDEPGSYLHETAQGELCKKLSDISQKEGVVIYCTHSPRLLSPEIIPLNAVLIVEKKKGISISATPLPLKNNTSSKRNTAMQPIFEALQMPEYEVISSSREKILCVEGIYDKYCIELFCNLSEDIRLLPSVSASAIKNNIQYLIAYQKKYVALWDNDTEGKKEMGQAKKVFGAIEAEKFTLLPDLKEKGKVRMEEMISEQDYSSLKEKVNLPAEATYETIISSLYFLNKTNRKKAMTSISQETRNNFAILKNIIDKKLGNE